MGWIENALQSVGSLGDLLGGVNPWLVAAALALQIAHVVLRSLAWRNVLRAPYGSRVPTFGIVAGYSAGVALNGLAPAKAGEVAKAVLVRTRIPGSTVPTIASSMAVVTVFDAVVSTLLLTAVFALGLVPHVPAPSSLLPAGGAPPAGAAMLAGVAVIALAPPAWLGARRFHGRIVRLLERLGQGLAILRTPGRYAREVVPLQAAAWACRFGVVYLLLAAFGLGTSATVALLVMMAAGVSALVPLTPGGVGTQQVMLAYALQETASTATAVSFSVGMQLMITIVNASLGLAAIMLLFRTFRPTHAIACSRRCSRARHD